MPRFAAVAGANRSRALGPCASDDLVDPLHRAQAMRIMINVRPSTMRISASRTRNSVSVSTLEIASSRMRIFGLCASASRANENELLLSRREGAAAFFYRLAEHPGMAAFHGVHRLRLCSRNLSGGVRCHLRRVAIHSCAGSLAEVQIPVNSQDRSGASTAARSMVFCRSRMLPGHE